jgi:hypothetical protein
MLALIEILFFNIFTPNLALNSMYVLEVNGKLETASGNLYLYNPLMPMLNHEILHRVFKVTK